MTEGNEGAKSFEFVIFKFLAEKKWKPKTNFFKKNSFNLYK